MRALVWTVLAVALGAPAAIAKPLSDDACGALSAEKSGLEAGGVEADMKKGPGWAKTNLHAAELGQIKRYIDISEQLQFRCQRYMPLPSPNPRRPR